MIKPGWFIMKDSTIAGAMGMLRYHFHHVYSVSEWVKYAEGNPEKPAIFVNSPMPAGNFCGSLDKYAGLLINTPKLQGGFIWDFVDQAILKKMRTAGGIPGVRQ